VDGAGHDLAVALLGLRGPVAEGTMVLHEGTFSLIPVKACAVVATFVIAPFVVALCINPCAIKAIPANSTGQGCAVGKGQWVVCQ